ncbi:MAG: DUF5063 domain-containing protein [Muribaculaceae bacterium]|nr:DUF5063 domain-containing protein [Muribaculaceae bacterium]
MENNQSTEIRHRLLGITALAARYCVTVENAAESEPKEFIAGMLNVLPRIYIEFNDLDPRESYAGLEPEEDHPYYGSYVDEDYYENIRRHIETLLGPDDTFLETFEEDMKYSETPIAASISECLADIFQPLYNFISIVKESDADELEGAYRECHENFVAYWSQTLCNVLRPLNNLFYNNNWPESEDDPFDSENGEF